MKLIRLLTALSVEINYQVPAIKQLEHWFHNTAQPGVISMRIFCINPEGSEQQLHLMQYMKAVRTRIRPLNLNKLNSGHLLRVFVY